MPSPGAISASMASSKESRLSRNLFRAPEPTENSPCCPTIRSLKADGADTTRVVLRVTDEFDAIRTYANDPIVFTLAGPAQTHRRQSIRTHRRNGCYLDSRQGDSRHGGPHCKTSTARLADHRIYRAGRSAGDYLSKIERIFHGLSSNQSAQRLKFSTVNWESRCHVTQLLCERKQSL